MFESREKKGAGGKSVIGLWATQAEQAEVKRLAAERGHRSVADYFRSLIREDIHRQEKEKERCQSDGRE